MTPKTTSVRKDEHLRINLEEDVSFVDLSTGLERYHLVHQALPEVNLEDVDTTTVFLGHHLSMPLLISSMTGGTEEAGRLNRTLAEVAQEAGIGMGLGSTRAMIEHPETTKTFKVRSFAPDILLLANLGAVQLQYGYGLEICQRLVAETEADGLYLHLNPLQEALQPEGNTRFAGLLRKIEMLCKSLEVPVIVKEVGWGLSARCRCGRARCRGRRGHIMEPGGIPPIAVGRRSRDRGQFPQLGHPHRAFDPNGAPGRSGHPARR